MSLRLGEGLMPRFSALLGLAWTPLLCLRNRCGRVGVLFIQLSTAITTLRCCRLLLIVPYQMLRNSLSRKPHSLIQSVAPYDASRLKLHATASSTTF